MKRVAARRPGFTLIELLIVIAIIAILASLLLVGLQKARARAEDLEARKDVSDLHQAVMAFINSPQLNSPGYLPSRFDPSGADLGSKAFINKVWPKAGGTLNKGGLCPRPSNPGGMLEGDQCLVFFLGGPQGSGWSTNPEDPTLPATTAGERVGPFYDFRVDRVKPIRSDLMYPSYLDRWYNARQRPTAPILYFSSYQFSGQVWLPNQYTTDVLTLPSGSVDPYFNSALGLGENLTTFQIICAGRDGSFGKLGKQFPVCYQQYQMSVPVGSPGYGGFDDITNFRNRPLGAVDN